MDKKKNKLFFKELQLYLINNCINKIQFKKRYRKLETKYKTNKK